MDNFSIATFTVLVHLSKNLNSQTHNVIHDMGFRRTALEHICVAISEQHDLDYKQAVI